jgi:4-azaleucine resistance transporter AzlC
MKVYGKVLPMDRSSDLKTGIRAGLPLVLPTLAGGVTFGVLAQPVMGSIAPIVMSLIVFSGAAQFAALTVLTAGGGAAAAIAAGMMMNGRWLPMGLAVGPFLTGGPVKRAVQSVALVDASFALASRGDGTYDRGLMIGATLPQAAAWIGGTAIGVVSSTALGDPESLGLDAMFPAFFAVLLAGEARGKLPRTAAATGAVIALALMPFAPPGVPVLAAVAAAAIGLRTGARREARTGREETRGGGESVRDDGETARDGDAGQAGQGRGARDGDAGQAGHGRGARDGDAAQAGDGRGARDAAIGETTS